MVTVGDLIFGGSGTIGHLYQYDPATGSTDLGEAVPGQTKINALVLAPDGFVYGGTYGYGGDGHLFRFDPGDPGTVADLGVPNSASSEVSDLTLGLDGLIYGASGDIHTLFSYDPNADEFVILASIPGISEITCMTTGPDGKLYGGEYPSGQFWVYDPATNQGNSLGQPVPGEYQIYAVAATAGGKIYGGSGWNLGHLFSYDIASGNFESFGAPVWSDTRLTRLVMGGDGQLYGSAGTARDGLFRFDPVDQPYQSPGTAASASIAPRMQHQTYVPATSEVWGLTVASDGWLYASGRAVGSSAILARWDTVNGGIMEHLGNVPGAPPEIFALLEGPDGNIYGAGGNYWGAPNMFSYDPASGTSTFLGVGLVAESYINTLILCPNGLIYGGTGVPAGSTAGEIFSYDVSTGDFTFYGQALPTETSVESLACAPGGTLYGGTAPAGRLFHFDPAGSPPTDLGQPIAGETIVSALTWGADGLLYGATAWYDGLAGEGGRLFSYDPASGNAVDLGRPIPADAEIWGLAGSPDGVVFGVTGSTEGHLFSYDTASGELSDLGEVMSSERYAYGLALDASAENIYLGTGYSLGEMVAYKEGYNFGWNSLDYDPLTPAGTELSVDVLDAAGNLLLESVAPGASLAEIPVETAPALVLRATLGTSDTSITPALREWSVTWLEFVEIAVDPASLDFEARTGGPDPIAQTLAVINAGSGELDWSISGLPGWLAVDPESGLAPSTVTFTASVVGLDTGEYTATLELSSASPCSNCPLELPVSLTVHEVPGLAATPASLLFQAPIDGPDPAAQMLDVSSEGYGELEWSVSGMPGWLAIEPESGLTPSTLALTATVEGLTAGDYPVTLILTSTPECANCPLDVPVLLTVHDEPALAVTPGELYLEAVEGETNPATGDLYLENVGTGVLTWTAGIEAGWLSVDATDGLLPPATTVEVRADPTGLLEGLYTAEIVFDGQLGCANCPLTVPVTLTVEPPPVIEVTPPDVAVTRTVGGPPVKPISLAIGNLGGGDLVWQAEVDVPWLWTVPVSGTVGDDLWLHFGITGLDAGLHDGDVVVSDVAGLAEPVTVPVRLTLLEPPPRIYLPLITK